MEEHAVHAWVHACRVACSIMLPKRRPVGVAVSSTFAPSARSVHIRGRLGRYSRRPNFQPSNQPEYATEPRREGAEASAEIITRGGSPGRSGYRAHHVMPCCLPRDTLRGQTDLLMCAQGLERVRYASRVVCT